VGIRATAAWQGSVPGHERARRQGADLKILEAVVWGAALYRAGVRYCEPNGESPATWYWFALNGDHERPLFAFPGIWQRWKGPVKKDGPNVEIDTYAFMTSEPNALTCAINHERMPVLLSGEDQFETWLSGPVEEAFALARSFDPGAMQVVQSGKEKEDLLGRRATAHDLRLL
jgi:putative SOS response-associated peptidase YedK